MKNTVIMVGELHYLAMTNQKLKNVSLNKINKSFVNCNSNQKFEKLLDFDILDKGYFEENLSSNYRKVFDRSVLLEEKFEKLS